MNGENVHFVHQHLHAHRVHGRDTHQLGLGAVVHLKGGRFTAASAAAPDDRVVREFRLLRLLRAHDPEQHTVFVIHKIDEIALGKPVGIRCGPVGGVRVPVVDGNAVKARHGNALGALRIHNGLRRKIDVCRGGRGEERHAAERDLGEKRRTDSVFLRNALGGAGEQSRRIGAGIPHDAEMRRIKIGHAPGGRRRDSPGLVEPEELEHRVLIVAVELGETAVFALGVHIAQREHRRALRDLPFHGGVDSRDRARGGGHVPGAVRIERAGADGLAVEQNVRLRAERGAVIRERYGEGIAAADLDAARIFRAVFAADGDALAGRRGGGRRFRVHGHAPVERDDHESAVLADDGLHVVAGIGVDRLDAACGGRGEIGVRRAGGRGADLAGEVFEIVLHRGDRVHDRGLVRGGERLPFGDDIAVCHEIFRDLHAVRHGDFHAVPAGERARARDGGVNVAALHGDGFRRARVLLLLTGGKHRRKRRHQNGDGHEHRGDDDIFCSFPFCFHVSLRNAVRRWASSSRPCLPDTARRSRRWQSRRSLRAQQRRR